VSTRCPAPDRPSFRERIILVGVVCGTNAEEVDAA